MYCRIFNSIPDLCPLMPAALRTLRTENVSCVRAQSCRLCILMDCSLARLPSPWDSPGKNTGVGCHFLLQGIFPTQGSNPGVLHYKQILYHLNHQAQFTDPNLEGSDKTAFRALQLLSPSSQSRRLLAHLWVQPSSTHPLCLSPPRSALVEYHGSLCRPNGDHHRVPDGVPGQCRAVPDLHPVSVSGGRGG